MQPLAKQIRTSAFLLASVTLALGCSERPPAAVADDGWGPQHKNLGHTLPPPAPRSKATPPAKRPRWERAGQLAELQLLGGRGRSEHLDGSFERTVRINPIASQYLHLVGGGAGLAQGALVVQQHHRPGSKAVVATYAMEKRAAGFSNQSADWEYFVIDEKNRVAARGPMPLCSRCHLEAPQDCLFGPPTSEP